MTFLTLLFKDPAPSHQSAVTPILSTVSITNMKSNLDTLSALNNRYYTSTTGAQASTIILNLVQGVSLSFFVLWGKRWY